MKTRKPWVTLQPIRWNDVPVLLKWRNDPEFFRFCTSRRNIVSELEFREELEMDFANDRQEQALILNRAGEPVGTIFSYGFNKEDGRCFVTIWLSAPARKRGYGALAFVLFAESLFRRFQLHKIYTEVYEYNTASLRPLLHGGLVEEGRFKGHRLVDRTRYDLIRLALYREPVARLYQKFTAT